MAENAEKNGNERENVLKSVTETIIDYLRAHYPNPGEMKSVRVMTKEIFEAIGVGSLNSVHIAMNKWRQLARERDLAHNDAQEYGFDEIGAKLPDMLWNLVAPLIERARRLQLEEDEEEITRLREENELLTAEADQEALLRGELNNHIETLTAEIERHEADFHGLEDKLSLVQKERENQEETIARLRNQMEELNRRLESLQEKLQEKESETSSLKENLVRVSTELKLLEPSATELKDTQTKLSSLTIELALAKQQTNVESELRAQALREIETLKGNLESLQKKNDEAIANAAAALSQKEFLLETIESLKSDKKRTRVLSPALNKRLKRNA